MISRCPECHVAWETGQPEQHLIACERAVITRQAEGHIHQRRGEHPSKRRLHKRETD